MSILTELQRITQAKADLRTAIESKEVTIEETATIDSYASKVDEVYSKGFEDGQAEGGSDSWYDTFWDTYQRDQNHGAGRRTDYRYAFSNYGWNVDNFKPKYDIKPYMADYMFYCSNIEVDLVDFLEKQGIILDFSNCIAFPWAFYGASFTRIGVVDMRKVSSRKDADNVFRAAAASKLHTIDKLIVSETYPIGTSSFVGCKALANITIEGLITGNFNIPVSPLTTESMKSIITHLKNYAGTDKEFTYAITFLSACWEALDAEGATSPNGNTWREYINDLGWNVG